MAARGAGNDHRGAGKDPVGDRHCPKAEAATVMGKLGLDRRQRAPGHRQQCPRGS
jgi:hypothetical protein